MQKVRTARLAAIFAAIACASAGSAHEITETMATPVRATLSSPKRPVDLELCVADAITQIGGAVPVPIRDGERNVHMLGYGHTPKIIVSLIASDRGTTIELRTKSGDMDDKMVKHLKVACQIA